MHAILHLCLRNAYDAPSATLKCSNAITTPIHCAVNTKANTETKAPSVRELLLKYLLALWIFEAPCKVIEL